MVHTIKKSEKMDKNEVYFDLDTNRGKYGELYVDLIVNNKRIFRRYFPNLFPFLVFKYAKDLAKQSNFKLNTGINSFKEQSEKFNEKEFLSEFYKKIK